MKSAREIYREIKKATKYQKKIEEIQKIENIQQRTKLLKEIDKEISTVDTNDNEYRKIDECINATYISLVLEGKAINEIKDDNVYNNLKADLIKLCKKVSYDKFYLWMVTDWKDYYDIKENDDVDMSKKIHFYMELKTIVMSTIENIEDENSVKKAKRIYSDSINIYKKILREIEDINLSILLKDNTKRDSMQVRYDNIDDEAKILLDKYRYLLGNMDSFNENNYWTKTKGDDEDELKRIERFFSMNLYRISGDIYNEHMELKKSFAKMIKTTTKKETVEKYKLYESIIVADKPNLESYFGDELDLLQRCRREYKTNPNIDILECIMRNEKVIEEERNQYWENAKREYEW